MDSLYFRIQLQLRFIEIYGLERRKIVKWWARRRQWVESSRVFRKNISLRHKLFLKMFKAKGLLVWSLLGERTREEAEVERTCLSNYGKCYFYFFILCSTRAALLLFHIYFIKHRFVCLLRQYRFRTFYCSIIFPFSSKLPLLFYAKGNFLYLFSILFQPSMLSPRFVWWKVEKKHQS